ncbi:serine carboxypeptidase [Thozetella sp. PMI_491]|nr:serine carboxypeptidase [Thozetella sp. PMI_491]
MLTAGLLLCGALGIANAQFPPRLKGVTTVKSKLNENVTISFKEPGICETTPGVKSYAGYVHLPPNFIDHASQDYPINTFFWFFEARKAPENAPLAIWLNGGPGASSIMGLLEENGPCFIGPDSKSTYLNPWSWNNEVNMLYLDQPNQVGFSYDVPTNGSVVFDGEDFRVILDDFVGGVPESNLTNRVGTFGSQKVSQTANSTEEAAHALWHFAQTWFSEFPNYKPADDRISLWAESYGGHYGPGFFRFFQRQNDLIANGTSPEENAVPLHLDTLGIVNGLIDAVVQGEGSIQMPYNNTYGIEIYNQSTYDRLMHDWRRPGGLKERLTACQEALKEYDPIYLMRSGKNLTELCGDVDFGLGAIDLYQSIDNGRAWFDIGHPRADPFPPPHLTGYLTEASVLEALGVPVNHSGTSRPVSDVFQTTFDIVHGGFLDAIAYLLDSGVKVHMMYGDRDFACNWIGGELASLAIPYSRSAQFANTGYSALLTPDGISGQTRQLGNYSFTRVFQAGHEVPSYQPAAAYEIFMRATFNRDIATGLIPVTDQLETIGPKDTWHIKNTPPEMPEPKCYVLKPESCTKDIWEKVVAGKVVTKDWFVVDVIQDSEPVYVPSFEEDQDVIADL